MEREPERTVKPLRQTYDVRRKMNLSAPQGLHGLGLILSELKQKLEESLFVMRPLRECEMKLILPELG